MQITICFRVPDLIINAIQNTNTFSSFIFKKIFESITVVTKFIHITLTDSSNFPSTFNRTCQWIDIIIPIKVAPFPTIIFRDIDTFIPTHCALILSVMNGKNGRHKTETSISKTILHHKRDKSCMMVVTMHYIRFMFPSAYPINYCDLKCHKTFGIVIISIYFFSVKQPVNIYKK